MIITIDGTVASGKSSVAKRLAADLGMHHLNTGLLYRTVALLSKQGAAVDAAWIKDLTYDVSAVEGTVLFKGQPVLGDVYNPDIDQAASKISADKQIRQLLLPVQRTVGDRYDIVADGRDCGSVVFPDAAVKIYLTANESVRAQRLMNDPARRYAAMEHNAVITEIRERDQRDKERDVAPLVIPQGATVIDSSDLTFEQTVARCNEVVAEQAPGTPVAWLWELADEYCRKHGCCDYKKT